MKQYWSKNQSIVGINYQKKRSLKIICYFIKTKIQIKSPKVKYDDKNIQITDQLKDGDKSNCFNTSMWLYKKYKGDVYILFDENNIHCFWYNGKYCVKWKYGSSIQDDFVYGNYEKIKQFQQDWTGIEGVFIKLLKPEQILNKYPDDIVEYLIKKNIFTGGNYLKDSNKLFFQTKYFKIMDFYDQQLKTYFDGHVPSAQSKEEQAGIIKFNYFDYIGKDINIDQLKCKYDGKDIDVSNKIIDQLYEYYKDKQNKKSIYISVLNTCCHAISSSSKDIVLDQETKDALKQLNNTQRIIKINKDDNIFLNVVKHIYFQKDQITSNDIIVMITMFHLNLNQEYQIIKQHRNNLIIYHQIIKRVLCLQNVYKLLLIRYILQNNMDNYWMIRMMILIKIILNF